MKAKAENFTAYVLGSGAHAPQDWQPIPVGRSFDKEGNASCSLKMIAVRAARESRFVLGEMRIVLVGRGQKFDRSTGAVSQGGEPLDAPLDIVIRLAVELIDRAEG